MNARYYDPQLGTFLSPDTVVPDAGMVVDYNRFLYARGDPVKYADPSGHCPAPQDGNNVICVDLFIASENIALGFGRGDDRTFDNNSDPSKSRAYAYIYLNDSGEVTGQKMYANSSCTLLGCAGPYDGHNSFEVTQDTDTGTINVRWNLSNGVTSFFGEATEELVDASTRPGGAEAGGAAGIVRAIASLVLPAINGNATLERGKNGNYALSRIDRDPYPSLEIYQYRQGQAPRTIVNDPQIKYLTPTLPLNPLFPNRRFSNQ
jgi:hypothetical protein